MEAVDKKKGGNTQVDGTTVHSNPLLEKKGETNQILEAIRATEAKIFAGAVDRTPKEVALGWGAAVQKENPDKAVRWCDVGDPQVWETRKQQGYTALPEEMGGKRIGNLVLAAAPKKARDARLERAAELHRRRMEDGGKQALVNELEGVIRELRDKHNVRIKLEDLLTEE